MNKIGLLSATIICMNAMIGAGIFTTPAKLATSVGPAGLITYLFVIFAVLLMALSIAKVAKTYPGEGSFYLYTKQWGGDFIGKIVALSYVFGIVIAMSLITQITGQYLHAIIPELDPKLLGFIAFSAIIALNMVGVKIMQSGQFILLGCTLFALSSTTVLCFLNADLKNLTPFMPYGPASIISGVSTAIFAFFGFESAASIYEIVENPECNVPRALTWSLLIVGLIYLAFIGSIVLAIPGNVFTDAQMPLPMAIQTVFPKYSWLARAIGIAILTAVIGVLQSMSYSISRLAFSLLKLFDNTSTKKITGSKNGFQIVVLGVGALVVFNFFAINSMNLFFNLTALFVVFAYTCSILTLVIKKQDKTLMQKFITKGGLLTSTAIFLNAFYSVILEITKLF